MTKFEEKLEKLPIKNIEHPIGDTKYYAAVHVKTLIAQADEEYQELFDKYSNLNDSYEKEVIRSSKLESQIIDLKSQFQQIALPVVPEDVAEWIEILKTKGLKPLKNPETYGETGFTEETLQNIVFWISEHQEDYMRAWLDGYTVEKPQLFYLREKNTGYYLRKKGNNEYGITPHYSTDYDEKYMHYKFTQQEIDSMQTGSYELVPVEDGE
ncbi:DUF1642 domain-containing protein [Lactococcus lactis subsp. cremoris]|nr:DUF1642 domain-containing protein [Lactococcus cremoris]